MAQTCSEDLEGAISSPPCVVGQQLSQNELWGGPSTKHSVVLICVDIIYIYSNNMYYIIYMYLFSRVHDIDKNELHAEILEMRR